MRRRDAGSRESAVRAPRRSASRSSARDARRTASKASTARRDRRARREGVREERGERERRNVSSTTRQRRATKPGIALAVNIGIKVRRSRRRAVRRSRPTHTWRASREGRASIEKHETRRSARRTRAARPRQGIVAPLPALTSTRNSSTADDGQERAIHDRGWQRRARSTRARRPASQETRAMRASRRCRSRPVHARTAVSRKPTTIAAANRTPSRARASRPGPRAADSRQRAARPTTRAATPSARARRTPRRTDKTAGTEINGAKRGRCSGVRPCGVAMKTSSVLRSSCCPHDDIPSRDQCGIGCLTGSLSPAIANTSSFAGFVALAFFDTM